MPFGSAYLMINCIYLVIKEKAVSVKGSYLHWLSLCLLPCALACTAETAPM